MRKKTCICPNSKLYFSSFSGGVAGDPFPLGCSLLRLAPSPGVIHTQCHASTHTSSVTLHNVTSIHTLHTTHNTMSHSARPPSRSPPPYKCNVTLRLHLATLSLCCGQSLPLGVIHVSTGVLPAPLGHDYLDDLVVPGHL